MPSSTLQKITRFLEKMIDKEDRSDEEMHAWLAFCDYVYTSDWMGDASEIHLAWAMFQAGYVEALETEED